jgi:uncharacterized repeat protein (TIGR01451 family)
MNKAIGLAPTFKRFLLAEIVLILFVSLVAVSSVEAQVKRQISAAKKARIAADVDGARPGGPVQKKQSFLKAGPLSPAENPVIFAYDFLNDSIISFNANTPETLLSNVLLTGLDLEAGELLEFIDFRPSDGMLYGVVTTDPPTPNARVVRINPTTGEVTNVSDTTTIPAIPGLFRGGDFNPVVDLLREVTDSVERGNRRLNPDTGALVGTDTALTYAAGDVNAGTPPNIVHVAYSNNTAGATQTTLYGIDANTDALVTIGSLNGTPTSPNTGQVFTVGELGENVGSFGGFDIEQGTNIGYAAFRVSGVSYLYTVNLTTGAATLIGEIGAEVGPNVDGLAIVVGPAAVSTDLAITKTNGTTNSTAGGSTVYTIVATNSGAAPVTGATVTDTLPASITSATWTCVGTSGGSCPGNGTGNINANVDLPVGASVTFTLTANISASATGNLVNTASITTPAGVTDSSPGNNSATDTDTLTPAAPTPVTVSGRVTGPNGRPLRNAKVTITNGQTTSHLFTSTLGYFVFDGILTGQTYTISVEAKRYTFTPQNVQVSGNVSNVDFVGQEIPE